MSEKKRFMPYRFTTDYYRKIKRLTSVKKVSSNSESVIDSLGEKTYSFGISNKKTIFDDKLCTCSFLPEEEIVIDQIPEQDECDKSEHEAVATKVSFANDLRLWALSYRLSLTAVSSLLKLLKSYGIERLPKDGRTLLKTPIVTDITEMKTGKFWYNGIKNNLITILSDIQQSLSISLLINVDGMSPFKSSPLQFWPISILIDNMRYKQPIIAGIYYGEGKPPLQLYFRQFIEELNGILRDGLLINGHKVTINIKCFVCDTPARSFIKGTPGSNAEAGSCIKCTVIGKWDKRGRHMSYPKIHCPLRTNESFRIKLDDEHHKEDTPLTQLPIDMVDDFVIADSLHLFDLGIMRRCLYGWREGSYNFRTKFSNKDMELLSMMLENCNKTRPIDIQRSIRGLKFLKFWKGSEYRVFLLYLGVVVLKDFLVQDVYEHFLILSCAVTILSCKEYLKHIDIAKKLLEDYIEKFIEIYGEDSISSNIHNLCHVVNDVKKFGPLPLISSYPFENFLGYIKSLVRNGNLPLSQISKRINELSVFDISTEPTEWVMHVKKEVLNEKHNISTCTNIYKEIHIANDFMLKSDNKNCFFMTRTGEIVLMINATYYKNKLHIYGTSIQNKYNFFDKPFKSSYLNIYAAKGELHSTLHDKVTYSCQFDKPKLYSLNEVKCKIFCLQYHSELIFMPLIHTIDSNIKLD